ncbi:hypothetical protein BROUX41_006792 [Berkeleyomyces rouxiae]
MASFPIPGQDGAYPRMPGQHKPVSMSQVQGFGFETDLEKLQREKQERRRQRKQDEEQQKLLQQQKSHKQLPRLPLQQQQHQEKPLPLPQKQLPPQPPHKQIPAQPRQPSNPLHSHPHPHPQPQPQPQPHAHQQPPPRMATLNRKPSMNPLVSPTTHQQQPPYPRQPQHPIQPQPHQQQPQKPSYPPVSPSGAPAMQSPMPPGKFYPGTYGQQSLPGQPASFPQQQQQQQNHMPVSPSYGHPPTPASGPYHQTPAPPVPQPQAQGHGYSTYPAAPVSPVFASPSPHQFREPTLPQLLPIKKPVAPHRAPRPDIPELQSGVLPVSPSVQELQSDVPPAQLPVQELQSDTPPKAASSSFAAELDSGPVVSGFIAEMPSEEPRRPSNSTETRKSSSDQSKSQDATPIYQANPWGFFLEDNPAVDPRAQLKKEEDAPKAEAVFEADSIPVAQDVDPGPVELADSAPTTLTTATHHKDGPERCSSPKPSHIPPKLEPIKSHLYERTEAHSPLGSTPAKSPGKFIPFRPGASPIPSPGLTPSASPAPPHASPSPTAQNAPAPSARRPSLASPLAPTSLVQPHHQYQPPGPTAEHQALKYRPSMPNMHIGTPHSSGTPPPLPSPGPVSAIFQPAATPTFPPATLPSPPPPYTPMAPATQTLAQSPAAASTPALPPRPSTSHHSGASAPGFFATAQSGTHAPLPPLPSMPQYPPPPQHPSLNHARPSTAHAHAPRPQPGRPQHLSSSSSASSSASSSLGSGSSSFSTGRLPRTFIGEGASKLFNSKAVKTLTNKATNIIETHVSSKLGSSDPASRSAQSPQQSGLQAAPGSGRSFSQSYGYSRG